MNIDGYKDINEFLVSDKKLFEYNLKKSLKWLLTETKLYIIMYLEVERK
jgi:hypothetical protein